MKAKSLSIPVALAAFAGMFALIKKKNKQKQEETESVGATHGVLVGKVLGVEWRNVSLYGNSSYWVYLETAQGFKKAYTAANSSIAYGIESMVGKTVAFDITKRKDGSIVINNTTADYDYYGNKR